MVSFSRVPGALVQGIICAGLAVYGDQMVKQAGKNEPTVENDP